MGDVHQTVGEVHHVQAIGIAAEVNVLYFSGFLDAKDFAGQVTYSYNTFVSIDYFETKHA